MNVFIVSVPNKVEKKKREIFEYEMDFKKSFFVRVLI